MDDETRSAAVERAYVTYRDDVYRVAFAILLDKDDAIEATQDAFARAFEAWERYDPGRPLRPWLHAITTRIALDHVRRRRVRRLALPGLSDQARIPGAYDGGDPASNAAPRQAIEEALAALHPIPRAAVLLSHRYGYDYGEIAQMLGISTSNVGAVLTRARAALRLCLADETTTKTEQENEA